MVKESSLDREVMFEGELRLQVDVYLYGSGWLR